MASQNRLCPYHITRIDYDNCGMVQHGNMPGAALEEKQPQADVLWDLKQLIARSCFAVDYQWVSSHQGDHREWSRLLLWEKINKIVDRLAKHALVTGVVEQDYIDRKLPFEQVRVSLSERKVVESLWKATSQHWSDRTARDFYHSKCIVKQYGFNCVLVWNGGTHAQLSQDVSSLHYQTCVKILRNQLAAVAP